MKEEVFAKKSLGQHWLDDHASLEAICDAADVKAGDTILEIGPGRGSLTASLLARGAEVVAVELDERLAADLRSKFSNNKFTLNMLSITEFDFSTMPKGYKVVANIPYYLTSHLLRLLAEAANPPLVAALLVQKEVAERVVANPGKMSLLAVSVQLYFEVGLGMKVPASLFTPPPKVDSQILILHRRLEPLFKEANTKELFRLVKAGFSEKRKKLRSSMSGGLAISKTRAETILHKAGIDPNLRAQELSLEDWYSIYNAVQEG